MVGASSPQFAPSCKACGSRPVFDGPPDGGSLGDVVAEEPSESRSSILTRPWPFRFSRDCDLPSPSCWVPTLFWSLWAIANEGQSTAAIAVTVGLAISLLPILLRVLPPLARQAATNKRDPNYVVTIIGLGLYVLVVVGVVVMLSDSAAQRRTLDV